jgi:hypothetical protein
MPLYLKTTQYRFRVKEKISITGILTYKFENLNTEALVLGLVSKPQASAGMLQINIEIL